MDFKTLYRETFSQVRAPAPVHLEEYKHMKHKTTIRRALLVAAVLCVFTALCLTAYATDFFGLHSFILGGDRPKDYYTPPAVEPTDENGIPQLHVPTMDDSDVLSLQGYNDAPESLALEEWERYVESCPPCTVNVTGFERDYSCYSVWSQEMADTLEGICAKYGLKLHTRMEILDYGELAEAVGGDFHLGNFMEYAGYMYEDGSFHEDDEFVDPEGHLLTFQLTRNVKGSLTDVMLFIGDADTYEQWQYECQGYTLTLALSPEKSLVIADLGDAVVSLNVLSGSVSTWYEGDKPVDKAKLEQLCDAFDWSLLAQVQAPDFDAMGFSGTDWDAFYAEAAESNEAYAASLE